MTEANPSFPSQSAQPDVLLRHAPWLRSLARTLVVDEHRADDVVQKTWVAALEHPPAQPECMRAWLARVARRFATGERRAEAARTRREVATARQDRQPSTLDLIEKLALERAVVDAVLALPEPQREVILLRYYEELSARAVAERLGLSIDVYWARMKRAQELLRQDLRGRLELRPGADERVDWRLALAPLAGLPPTLTTSGSALAAATLTTTWITMSTKMLAAIAAVALGALSWWLLDLNSAASGTPSDSDTAKTSLTASEEETPRGEFLNAPQADRNETLRSSTNTPAVAQEANPTHSENVAGAVVTGKIVDQRGDPVPQAKVVLDTRGRGSDFGTNGLVFVDVDDIATRRDQRREALTRADGSFEFHGVRDAGAYQIDVEHPLLLTPKHRLSIEANQRVDIGTLTLRLGAAVRGRVVNHLAEPLPNTWVRAEEHKENTSGLTFITMNFGRTDEVPLCDKEGWFRVGPLDPELRHDLLVSAAGSPRVTSELQKLVAGVETELAPITIDRSSSLRGRVLAADGEPVAAAKVSANPSLHRMLDFKAVTMDVPASTDADGAFALYGLNPGNYSVQAQAPVGNTRVEGIAHNAQNVELRFRATNRVEGIVVDSESGAPVVGATVAASPVMNGDDPVLHAININESFRDSTTTDENGRFVFEDLPVRATSFQVESTTHAPKTQSPIDIPKGGRTDIVIRLEPGIELVIEVISAVDRQPLANAEVELFTPMAEVLDSSPRVTGERRVSIGMRRSRTSNGPDLSSILDTNGGQRLKRKTDELGRAHFGGLEPRSYELVASHAAYASAQRSVEVRGTENATERLELHRGGTLVGKALAFGGAPLQDRGIIAEATDARRKGTHQTKTNSKGEFRIDHLAVGSYSVRIADRGPEAVVAGDVAFSFAGLNERAKDEDSGVPAEIIEGQSTEIELRQSPRASLEVLVMDQGLPVAGALVDLKPSTSDAMMAQFMGGQGGRPTDERGMVKFEDLEPGSFRLTWGPKGAAIRSEREVELAAEMAEHLEVDLPGGTIAGIVEDSAKNVPIAGARVELQRAGSGAGGRRPGALMITRAVTATSAGTSTTMMLGADSSQTTDAQGRFRFEHVPAGEYVLVLQADGFGKETTAPFPLRDRERNEDRVEQLSPGGLIEGGFLGLDVAADGMVIVTATLLDENNAPVGQPTRSPVEAGSRYTLDGLKAGRYRLSARVLGMGSSGAAREAEPIEVELRAGEKLSQDLRF